MRFLLVALAGLLLWAAAPPAADLILYNGKIVTVDKAFSIRKAVSIAGDKIVAVGDDREILAQRQPRTRAIDLQGRTVLPGLIDSHVHPIGAGLSEYRRPLPKLDSIPAVQQFIREQARETPKGAWIRVPRTFPTRLKEMRMPTRADLDPVSPDHPVLFDASYTVVVNSAALRVSGITRDTPNPPAGEIVKDVRGEPNGILKNAQSLLKTLTAQFDSEADRLAALELMLRKYVDAGITSVTDRSLKPPDIALYEKLKAEGKLPLRVTMTVHIDPSPPTADVVRQIESMPYVTGQGDDWLRIGSLKVTLDGGMTIGTAFQRVPYGAFGEQLYAQTDPHYHGLQFIPGDKLAALARAANRRGWQVSAHDQGGGAVDAFLEALEAADRDRPTAPRRSHWIHASFQSPEAIARAKKIGLLADVQTAWLHLDGAVLAKVFPQPGGMRYFIPLRSYVDAGVIVAGGSDHMIGHDRNRAVNPYNPFHGMWVAVARKTVQGTVITPEERLRRDEALRMYTDWAAYMQFAETKKGRIEPGLYADLVIIDRDYLTCPEDDIKDIQIVATILNGRVAYERP